MPHRSRPPHGAANPVHVTLRRRGGLPPLREQALFARMTSSIRAASRSPAVGGAFRVIHFSVQNDHVHLIVEARDRSCLSRGVQGLAIRLARAVNDVLGVTGKVWGDRYHSRDLHTPREVRNAIVYVLMNVKKHARRATSSVDLLSSAPWFDGFADVRPAPRDGDCPVMAPRTWLAGVGWRRHGLVRLAEAPSGELACGASSSSSCWRAPLRPSSRNVRRGHLARGL